MKLTKLIQIVRNERGRRLFVVLPVLTVAVAACGSDAGGSASASQLTLRLGYLPNLTHAPALVGVQQGIFARDLGSTAALRPQTFNAGPAAVTALISESIDAAFIGPSPAVNAYVRSHGSAIRIVAGTASGGAGLVVRPAAGIHTAQDLRGRSVATPQLGNTQDVALRAWLRAQGLATDPQGGGDVKITPTDNGTTLQLFKQGQIDGAWVPEPYLTRLLQEDGGQLLVDEASLWPAGQFATTNLVVTTTFLDAHPDAVRGLIRGLLDSIAVTTGNATDAKTAVNAQLRQLTQRALPAAELDAAWSRLTFTADPVATSLRKSADDARAAGLLPSSADLHGIYDLRILNGLLRGRGLATVDAAGLGAV